MEEIDALPLKEKMSAFKAYVVKENIPPNLTYLDSIEPCFVRQSKRVDGTIEEKYIYPHVYTNKASSYGDTTNIGFLILLQHAERIKLLLNYVTGLVQMQYDDLRGTYNPIFIEEMIELKKQLDQAESPPTHVAISFELRKLGYDMTTLVTSMYFYSLGERRDSLEV